NFQPLPYIPYFVNKTTTEPTLQQLIQAATSSSEFIMDTESTSNFNAQNEPKNPREKLSADQLRQIHNRSCTIKQRRRYYKNELIFENIDYRFSIKQIKMILKEEKIPIYIVNTTTTTENTRKLFVAVRNAKLLKTYEQQTQHLFTKIHYEQLKANRRLLRDAQH
ncbi:unnamed protein product, partial [Rotaria magnacalcarata]